MEHVNTSALLTTSPRHCVFRLYICPVLVNIISQEHLKGICQRSRSQWPSNYLASYTYLKSAFRKYFKILTSCHIDSKIN